MTGKHLSLGLDIARILAAQAVLVGHLLTYIYPFPNLQNGAVVVFFFISGYLIAATMAKKRLHLKKYSFKQFFLERLSRIYIVFIPVILLVVLIDGLSIMLAPQFYRFYDAYNLKTFLANLLMLQYWPSIPFGSGRPFWALPLLWWNYLAYGWLSLSKNKWPAVIFAIIPLLSLFYGRGQGLALAWWLGAAIYYLPGKRIGLILHDNRLVKFFTGYSLTLYLVHYSLIMFFRQPLVAQPRLFFWLLLIGCNLTAALLAGISEKQTRRLAFYLLKRL